MNKNKKIYKYSIHRKYIKSYKTLLNKKFRNLKIPTKYKTQVLRFADRAGSGAPALEGHPLPGFETGELPSRPLRVPQN